MKVGIASSIRITLRVVHGFCNLGGHQEGRLNIFIPAAIESGMLAIASGTLDRRRT